MATLPQAPTKFPAWIRSAVLVWFVTWIPAYWRTWVAANFLHLCDVAVILACAGARLLSLFHIAMPVLLLWALDRTGYDRRGWALQCAIARGDRRRSTF